MPPQDPNQNQPAQTPQPIVGGPGPVPNPVQPTAPITPAAPQQPLAPTVQPVGQPPVQPIVSPALNPQPTVQTAMPSQPMQPMGQAMGGMSAMTPVADSSNKKTILTILGAVFGVIILLVIGVYAMSAFGSVSKEDYKKSLSVARDAAEAYSSIGTGYVSAYSTETEIAETTQKIKTSSEKFNKKFVELGKTKAIQRDKKLHDLYVKLETKKKTFDSMVGFTIETYTYIMPAVSQYTQNSLTTKNSVGLVSQVRQKLEDGQSSLKNESNITFVSEYTKELKSLETAAKKVKANPRDYGALNDYYDIASKIRKTTSTWTSAVSDMKDKGDIFNEFNDLGRAIAAKATGGASSDASGWIYQLPFKALTR